jgi:NTP pyrophosphatase (non-canonical NTP hydrolase)
MLKKLWRSTRALHQRFGLFPPNPVAVRKVFQEEVRELLEAGDVIKAIIALPDEQRTLDDLIVPRQHFAEEFADVLVTMLALADSYGVSKHTLKRAATAVVCKNDAKTDATHEINKAGKIARRKEVVP